MNDRLITGTALAIAACSLGLAAYAVLVVGRSPAARPFPPAFGDVRHWQAYSTVGHRDGPKKAPVTIVLFTDYQCPACRRSAGHLEKARLNYPSEVAVVVRHFPLASIHPVARRAAFAAECAGEQGRFTVFQKLLYDSQDSLDRVGWGQLAGEAKISDAERFVACVRDSTYLGRVERDIRAGNTLPVEATPTLLVNETKIIGVPSAQVLDSLIQAKLSTAAPLVSRPGTNKAGPSS